MSNNLKKSEIDIIKNYLHINNDDIVKILYKKYEQRNPELILKKIKEESKTSFYAKLYHKLKEVYDLIKYDNSIKGSLGEAKASEILCNNLGNKFFVINIGAKNSGFDILLIEKNKPFRNIRIDVKTAFMFNTMNERKEKTFWCPTIASNSIDKNKFDFIMNLGTKKEDLSDLGKEYYIYSQRDLLKIRDKALKLYENDIRPQKKDKRGKNARSIGTYGSGQTIWKLKKNWEQMDLKPITRKACVLFNEFQYMYKNKNNITSLLKND